jgi:hypothetical protein
MPESTIAFTGENYEELFLVGVRLQSHPHELVLYALVLYYEAARGDRNRPLTSGGRIVFFKDPFYADQVLGTGDMAFRKYERAPRTVSYLYDLPGALQRIQYESSVDDASLLNVLNELADFVRASEYPVPHQYQHALNRFADWLTFSNDYTAFFESEKVSRGDLIDAMLWSVGAVVARSVVAD